MEQFSLVVRPHIFSDRECTVTTLPLGKTIGELIALHTQFDPSLGPNLVALINGEIEDNFDRIPMAGDTVTIALRVHGGGGNGKSILSLVAVIALTVVSGWAGAAAYGSGFGTAAATAGAFGTSALGASLVSAGVMMVGSLVINAVFAPPKATVTGAAAQGANAGNTYSFGSQGNQVRQFGRIIKVYGQHKVVPDVAGLPYTLNVGDDTYFYALYCFGYGPLKVEDFKIGQNSLANYTNYDINVIENFTDSSQLTIYKNDIWQEAFNSELSQKVGPLTFTTRPLTDQAILDLVFPQGLVQIDKKTGAYKVLESSLRIEVRDKLVPGSTFGPLTAVKGRVPTVSRGALGGMFSGMIAYSGDSFNSGSIPQGMSRFDIATWAVDKNAQPVIPTPGSFIKIGGDVFTVKAANLTSLELTAPLPSTIKFGNPGAWQGDYPFTYSSGADSIGGDWVITDNKTGSFPASIDFALPKASTWEIRVTSVSPDRVEDASFSYVWPRTVVGLKSIKSDVPPMKPEVPLTVVELRIKATGQLNGSVEEFSGVATSKLRQWRNGQWVVDVTRNVAWAYLDALTGKANTRALPDSRVDIEKIKSWALKNELIVPPFTLPSGYCDVVIDRDFTMWELLQSLAAVGRAAPTMRDSKYSIIIDDEARQPVQMFSPRNSTNLQSSRTYLEGPHALRVKWIDPQANYAANAALVYRTGYDENSATVFEDLDTFGITSQEAAIRYGRYTMAQGLLRQERFTINVDIENIICTRGDLVLVAHDVITVGGETARIRYISGNVLEIDAPLSLQFDNYQNTTGNASQYGIRVRKSTGYMTGVLPVAKLFGQEITVENAGMLVGVAEGDMLVYGAMDSIVGQYTVDQVSSGSDFNATISLEEYAPLVYQAEYTGIIPEYVPQRGASYQRGAPRELNATIIEYVEDAVYPRCRIHLTWIPPQGTVSPIKYTVSEIRSDNSELFMGETPGLDYTTEQIDMWILGGSTIKFAVRAYFESTGPGSPAFYELNLPERATVAPPNFDFFEVVPLPSGLRKYNFSYTKITPPAHVTGGEIRYYPGRGKAPDWSNMTNLAGEYPTMPYPTSGVELSNPPAGDWTFGIRAVDQLGVLADQPLYFSITLPRSINQGITPDADFTPPPTPTGFKASGFFSRILIEQDEPTYSAGGGHQSSSVYGLVYVDGTPEPTFAQARLIQEFTGNVAQIAADLGTKYRLWLKWRTRADVESVVPAGPLKVETGQDVAKLINLLQGQLTATALHKDLASRIDLIDAGDNVPGSVSARIKRVEELITDADGAVAAQIETVQARLNVRPNLLPNGGFEIDNVTGANYFLSTPFSRFADAWGTWIYTNSPGTTGFFGFKDVPVFQGADYVFTGDMRKIGAGIAYFRLEFVNAANAVIGTVNGPNLGNVSFDFSNEATRRQQLAVQGRAPAGAVAVRSVVGWSGMAANTQFALRFLKLEQGTLPSTFYTMEGGQAAISASVQVESKTRATQTGDLYAQYTVKQDVNGYISGYGLASTVSNAVPSSAFAVRADSFYIANPTGPGVVPAMPFIVRTVATTINGVPVPVGVYLVDAFIQNGTIVNAKIANATIEDAKILNLSAAKINTGFLSADRIQAGTISASKLNIGTGQNILQDSTWVNRYGRNSSVPSGWEFYTNGAESQFEVWTEITYPTWFPTTARGFVMQKKTGASGVFMYLDGKFLVEAGKRYEGSVFAGAHRCDVYCEMIFISYTGAEISRVGGPPNSAQQAGGRVLGDFKRIGVFGFAPEGAAYAIFRIVKNDTYGGQPDSFAFILNPMAAVANSAQVDFSPYAPAGSGVQITPSGINTPNLSSLNNNLGYIGAGQITINGETVSGGWGYIRSPNKWLDNNYGWIMANNIAAGESFISFVCGGMKFQMHSTPGGSSAVIDFAGFYADSTGAVVLRTLDVIDSLNIRGGAVGLLVASSGVDQATVGVTVPNGQIYEIKLEAFARPIEGTALRNRGGYSLRIPPNVSAYAPLASIGADDQNIVYAPVPVSVSSTFKLGAGFHNLRAYIESGSVGNALIVDVSAQVFKRPAP